MLASALGATPSLDAIFARLKGRSTQWSAGL